mmetsp:Transcript_104830/g.301679  ORF Transcript_104830/g.301679 Transcript_104830/m.301679 type:complete len:214 (-) Transcript_104830:444-1085(-)
MWCTCWVLLNCFQNMATPCSSLPPPRSPSPCPRDARLLPARRSNFGDLAEWALPYEMRGASPQLRSSRLGPSTRSSSRPSPRPVHRRAARRRQRRPAGLLADLLAALRIPPSATAAGSPRHAWKAGRASAQWPETLTKSFHRRCLVSLAQEPLAAHHQPGPAAEARAWASKARSNPTSRGRPTSGRRGLVHSCSPRRPPWPRKAARRTRRAPT